MKKLYFNYEQQRGHKSSKINLLLEIIGKLSIWWMHNVKYIYTCTYIYIYDSWDDAASHEADLIHCLLGNQV